MKTYIVEFGGNVMAQIVVTGENILVTNCIDGFGNTIELQSITITEETK